MMVKAEDCFVITATVGTSESEIFQVSSRKLARVVYGVIASDTSGAANYVELRIYKSDGTTLYSTTRINVAANDTYDRFTNGDNPVLLIPTGYYLKAIAGGDSVQLHLSCYDIGK